MTVTVKSSAKLRANLVAVQSGIIFTLTFAHPSVRQLDGLLAFCGAYSIVPQLFSSQVTLAVSFSPLALPLSLSLFRALTLKFAPYLSSIFSFCVRLRRGTGEQQCEAMFKEVLSKHSIHANASTLHSNILYPQVRIRSFRSSLFCHRLASPTISSNPLYTSSLSYFLTFAACKNSSSCCWLLCHWREQKASSVSRTMKKVPSRGRLPTANPNRWLTNCKSFFVTLVSASSMTAQASFRGPLDQPQRRNPLIWPKMPPDKIPRRAAISW